MTDDTLLPFHLPAVQRKKVTAAFDGGLISSDGGLVLLRETERRLGLAETLASCIRDRRNPALVVHSLAAMLRFRMLAIACGYEDADDCDALRADPLFKLAVGHAPESGRDLCSQPTMSRLENAPSRIEVARDDGGAGRHLLPQLPSPSRRHHPRHRRYLRSGARPPAAVALSTPITTPAASCPSTSTMCRAASRWRSSCARARRRPASKSAPLLKHLVRRIRRHWPRTRIVFRGDSHYGRPQAMAWCEANGVDYIFGLAGNSVLHALAHDVAVDLKKRRAEAGADRMRTFAAFAYAARSWNRKRAGHCPAGGDHARPSIPATSSPRSTARHAISTKMSTAPEARPRT